MNRIHPSDRRRACHGARRAATSDQEQPSVYTVWKRSSMGFQGTDGFSVYDAAGRLAFRVDNYARRPKAFAGELLLMDGRGAPLLSLRPQVIIRRFFARNTICVSREKPCNLAVPRTLHLTFACYLRDRFSVCTTDGTATELHRKKKAARTARTGAPPRRRHSSSSR
jgi:uncharacterized protein YxjI